MIKKSPHMKLQAGKIGKKGYDYRHEGKRRLPTSYPCCRTKRGIRLVGREEGFLLSQEGERGHAPFLSSRCLFRQLEVTSISLNKQRVRRNLAYLETEKRKGRWEAVQREKTPCNSRKRNDNKYLDHFSRGGKEVRQTVASKRKTALTGEEGPALCSR